MPLPEANTTWPPASLTPIFGQMGAWSALYANDTGNLGAALSQGKTDRQGVINRFLKFFWDQTSTDLTKPPERKIHVPVASDIASASADLLFSEPPTVTVASSGDADEKTGERLDLITGPDFQQLLTSAAETSAALGGTYLRAIVDKTIANHPFITKVDADAAIPEFRHGRLTAVTFWHVVNADNGTTTRHLERHETDAKGFGLIVHGLYRGTRDNLGQPVPFTESPETAWLTEPGTVDHLINGNTISTQTPGLAVAYAPNVIPSRAWRSHPIGAHLGRSDFDGIEPLMDALDEAFSSLMRDIRLGKSMLVVPETMLDNNGPGRGASFSHDEIFTPVNAAPGSAADSKMAVEQVQFNIRVTEHEQTIMLLWNRIIASAGYSSQTFGESMEYRATATEVTSRERRSYMTRDRKIRSFQPALEAIVAKALAMDSVIFKSGAKQVPVRVQFADGIQDDQEALARTASLLATALSASIETRVRLLHKDWDETAIEEEVARIRAENDVTLADPDINGVNGFGLSDQYPD